MMEMFSVGLLVGSAFFVLGFVAARIFSPRRQARSPREYALGFGTTTVDGGESATVSARPGVEFEPARLLFPPLVGDFLVEEVLVGEERVLRSVGALPVSAFAPGAGIPLAARVVASPSSVVAIRVRNLACHSRDFQGCVVGPARR